MTPRDLVYWLQGFFEISGATSLTEGQVQIIQDHLALVFKKETPDRKYSREEVFELGRKTPYYQPDYSPESTTTCGTGHTTTTETTPVDEETPYSKAYRKTLPCGDMPPEEFPVYEDCGEVEYLKDTFGYGQPEKQYTGDQPSDDGLYVKPGTVVATENDPETPVGVVLPTGEDRYIMPKPDEVQVFRSTVVRGGEVNKNGDVFPDDVVIEYTKDIASCNSTVDYDTHYHLTHVGGDADNPIPVYFECDCHPNLECKVPFMKHPIC